MTFKNEEFQYRVFMFGVFFVLKNQDGEEITKSRAITKIAKVIFEDQDLISALEENRINLTDLDFYDSEELKQSVEDLKFKENYITEDETI